MLVSRLCLFDFYVWAAEFPETFERSCLLVCLSKTDFCSESCLDPPELLPGVAGLSPPPAAGAPAPASCSARAPPAGNVCAHSVPMPGLPAFRAFLGALYSVHPKLCHKSGCRSLLSVHALSRQRTEKHHLHNCHAQLKVAYLCSKG